MRYTRIRRFRDKYKNLLTGIQILSLWGLLIIGATELNTYTNAAFNDVVEVTGSLHVDWDDGIWDKSSLEFIDQGIDSEDPKRIFSVIKNGNDSGAMEGTVNFEVYYINSGNPKNGEKIYTGSVPALTSGESYKLYFEPEQDGNYMFKAYQREGHPGNGELWSEEISFKNIEVTKQEEEEKELKEEAATDENNETEAMEKEENSEQKSEENENASESAEQPNEEVTSSEDKTVNQEDKSKASETAKEESSESAPEVEAEAEESITESDIEKEQEEENEKASEDNK